MKAPQVVSTILKEMARAVRPGIKTVDLDAIAEKMIMDLGVTSANKGYKPEWAKEPWSNVSCIGVNHIISHGRPSDYVLQEGDIVSLDLGVRDADGNCGDAALTVGVGEISNANQRLLYYTKQTLYEIISHVRAGVGTEILAEIAEYHALSRGYLMNRKFGGHTIGKEMHMTPMIYNTREKVHKYDILKVGQVICIEPMMTRGKDNVGVSPDGWTFFTRDGKESALFEHMVLVKENGAEILTDHFTYEVGQP